MSFKEDSISVRTFFLWIPKNSPIHKLHPITKIILMLSLGSSVFLFSNIIKIFSILILSIFLLFISKIPIKMIWKFLLASTGMISACTIAWMLFSMEIGNIIYFEKYIEIIPKIWIWHIYITENTIFKSLTIGLKILSMVLISILFLTTMRDREFIYGLRKMHLPFPLCLATSLTFRAMYIFRQDYQTVKEAMMSRGVDFKTISIPKKIVQYSKLFIPILSLLFKRAQEMTLGVEARGIPLKGGKYSLYHDIPIKNKDYLVIILIIFILLIIFYLPL